MSAAHDPLPDLREFLLAADGGVRALLGGEGHAYIGAVPPRTTGDYLVIHQLDDPRIHHLRGASATRRTLVQIEVWTRGEGAALRARALALAVEDRLDAYRGAMHEVWCHGAFQTAKRGPVEEDVQDGAELGRFYVQLDFTLTTSVPAGAGA